jgi:hypothetical protein
MPKNKGFYTMKNIIKLSIVLFSPIFLYSIDVPSYNSILSYTVEDKFHTYQEKIPLLDILQIEQNDNAVTVVKSSKKHYTNNRLEIEFIIEVTLHRDITDLVISDNITQGFKYQDASIRLNRNFPSDFDLLDSVLTLHVGDAKKGYSYTMSYIAEPPL